MKKVAREFYEIKDVADVYGLAGTYESAEKALEEINRSYEYAKTQGYDNREEKWVIVCNEVVKVFDDKGAFLKETVQRFVCENVEFGDYENAFVFVY